MEMNYLNFELLGLLIIGLLSLSLKKQEINQKLTKIAFLAFLITNPLQIVFIFESPNFLFEIALIIASEVIVGYNLVSIIIKSNLSQHFNNSIIIITSSLIGIVTSLNLLVMVGWLACLLYFLLINFFNSGETKKFDEYKLFIIPCSIAIVALLSFSIFFVFIEGSTDLFYLLTIKPEYSSISLIILLFVYGTFGGIFPFNLILHRFYRDSDFQTSVIYMIIPYALLFSLFRLIFLIDMLLFQFGVIFLLLSIFGLISSIYKILDDFFFKLGRKVVSLRKVLGDLFIIDFNNLLLLASLFFIAEGTSVNLFSIYIFISFLSKFMLIIPIQYKMKRVNTDDLNKIGNLYREDQFLGIVALISGLISAFPLSYLSFNLILDRLISLENQLDSMLASIIITILVVHSIYILINIIMTASISIKINFHVKSLEEG